MQFFDLVNLKEETDLEALADRLGYKKIFGVGRDVNLISGAKNPDANGRNIVMSGDSETLTKAVRNSSVIGVVVESDRISRKFMDELRKSEKLLFIPVSALVCSDRETRMQKLHRARGALRNALMTKVNVAVVTLAEERECMLSSLQLLEIAKLLGASEGSAKKVLGTVGSFI